MECGAWGVGFEDKGMGGAIRCVGFENHQGSGLRASGLRSRVKGGARLLEFEVQILHSVN